MRNRFIIWMIGLVFLIGFQLSGQIQFEASKNYGQLFDVSFHPTQQDVIYARTVTNHIVKSNDKGARWEVIYSRPQENSYVTIKDMKIINNGTTLSFICSAQGTRLNKVVLFDLETRTVIKEFSSPIENEEGNLIQSYSIYEPDNDILLLHTTKGDYSLITEIFYTKDGGESWRSVYYGPDNGDINVNNVAIAPENPEKLFLMRGGSPNPIEGGLLISNDGGQTWTEKIPGTTYSAITFNPSNPEDIFVGTFYLGYDQEENLYRSTDGGETWNVVPINWTSMSTNSIQSITYNPLDTNQILILEENEIVVSYDRGNTWENYVYEEIDTEDYYFGIKASFNPFLNNEVIISANFYPFISQDGGRTLSKLLSPFVNSTGRMAVHNGETKHLYYGLRHGYIHKDLETGLETEYGLIPIDFYPTNSPSGIFADPVVAGRVFSSTMHSMTGNSSISMSLEHGANPEPIFGGSYLKLMSVGTFEPNPNLVLMSMGEILYKVDLTDLSNVVATEIYPPHYGYITQAIFDAEDANTFYLAQWNKFFKTENSGQTWTEISNGLGILTDRDYIYDLKTNPLNTREMAMATSQGVFKSEDKGESWTQIYTETPMNRVEFSPYSNGKIIASSYFEDGDAYPASISMTVYSKDGGESWEEIGTDELGYLIATSTEMMFREGDFVDVYYLVQDLGLVKHTVDLSTLGTQNGQNGQILIRLYPNPATDIIYIQSKSEIETVVIYDLSGKKVLEQKSAQIDVSSLPKGIYVINTLTKDGSKRGVRLIKQ